MSKVRHLFLQSRLGKRVRFHLGRWLAARPRMLARLGIAITVVDQFGTPGDTLLTAVICRELKERYPRLRVYCRTPNPVLLRDDPYIDAINGAETWVTVDFNYLGIIHAKDGQTNLLRPTMTRLGVASYRYQARVFLTEEERAWASRQVAGLTGGRPIVTINVQSREQVKVWPIDRWDKLVRRVSNCAAVIQLGAADEPHFADVYRFAGRLSLRESMAILSEADVHVGPVSFLMHAANGLRVPSVIIYGGRETPENSGYYENANLYTKTACSPCWLHDSRGDRCPYSLACMDAISVEDVEKAILDLLSRRRVMANQHHEEV